MTPHEHLLPLLVAIQTGKSECAVKRYAGCSFFIDPAGTVVTCKHLFEGLGDEELIVGKHLGRDEFVQLHNIVSHPTVDFAVAETPLEGVNCLSLSEEEAMVGTDVQAFGFTEWERNDEGPVVHARLLKGYVSRIHQKICELSFPSLMGFSGAPVITEKIRVVGMLYGNAMSRITDFLHTEIDEEGKKFEEKTQRITEFGLMHTVATIRLCLADLGYDDPAKSAKAP